MKIKSLVTILLALLVIQANELNGQVSKVREYKVTVKGTSSLHDWESNVEKLACKTSYKIENNKLINIKNAILKITVESIKSTKGKVMDEKTYDAFNSEQHPFIVFTLRGENINPSDLTVILTGTLAMAGATKPIDLIANYRVLANGDFQIMGNKKIKMTEFNMKPPKAVMGTIKVGDEVDIIFDITFSDTPSIL
jgi:hypothetical protein